mmetsp:Transcript_29280/g.70670  ORF Transcript_29280/g.70670 Transcript_29280/m.70670 type:complete len:297 (+) Transcript_29280:243-1133(+)|eukprot:CAMPEP_0181101412 /NCGR_PEP_ID=MMETSP1071-20121207/13737_1 /TAXON_ID=35127 /ORGANISM="Thalassiosira sp., Strain NH16" /LENGTH=296 /DNA_ID=CAMNT_0023184255 /DNA_START=238 /DNA_END=1128 /DNA_ORIENTATION=+
MSDTCAACGIGGRGLKICNGCNEVKYCGRECQLKHRPVHKSACKKRAAERLDEKLFKDPPTRDECPICTLPLPIEGQHMSYQSCCGNTVCYGCTYAANVKMRTVLAQEGNLQISISPPCPFCRVPLPASIKKANERIQKRMDLGDAQAYCQRAGDYCIGIDGTPLDYGRAFELYTRSVELGSADAHYELGNMYRSGKGRDVDVKKARHHYQMGAIGGNLMARSNLGVLEAQQGKTERAMKHFMIAARNGFGKGMDGLQMGYSKGLVTKEELDEATRAYEFAVNEMKSEQRSIAAVQ